MNIPLNSIDATEYLTDVWIRQYGLYGDDADTLKSPFLNILALDGEDNYADNGFMKSANDYKNYGIKDMFGLSLIEFVSLPKDKYDILIDIARTPTEPSKEDILLNKLADQI